MNTRLDPAGALRPDNGPPAPRRRSIGEALVCAGTLALLWAVLNPGDHKSWLVGLPVILCATALALRLHSPVPRRFSLLGALRFALFFVHHSFKGGWDVARRAFSPSLPLDPALLTCPLRLPNEPAQVFLVNVISLLPGTVSAGLEHGVITLHALDGGPATLAETRALEERVAALFALELAPEREASV